MEVSQIAVSGQFGSDFDGVSALRQGAQKWSMAAASRLRFVLPFLAVATGSP
jgi:hypothetical protein